MSWFDAIRDLLFRLTPYLPSIIGMLVVSALSILTAVWLLVRRSRKATADAAADEEREAGALDAAEPFQVEPDDLPLLPMRKSFRHALQLLKMHVAGRDWRYAIPWYLLIGPEGAGKSTLIRNTDMSLPVGAPADDWEDVRPACKWWFFDRGVVLDVAGQLVRARRSLNADRKAWSLLLRLLDHHRPRRPVDGVILTLPIDDLLGPDGDPLPTEQVAERAEALYKKLWQAQNALGLAFPVYVIVTKCDRLTGFKPFVQELPESAHADMLGWSSPYSLETEFRREWIDEAVDQIDGAVRAAQMELFAERADLPEAEALFLLPGAIEKLREPLAEALRHIFKASAYHEAFSLRGVYLTGDGGAPPPQGLRPLPVLPGVYAGPKEEVRPAFLHDLFEDKIFPENGLARPARRALLSRNRTALGAQAALAALVVGGGLGLAVDYGALQRGVASVEPLVRTVQSDMAEVEALRRAALARGEAPAGRGSFDREKALTLLDGMSRVEADSFAKLFMPTSWATSVDDRIVRVTTEAFNHFILQTMRAALVERGAAIVEGRLAAAGAEADAGPERTSGVEALAAALPGAAVDYGPEYAQLRRYVEALRRFEDAVDRFNALRARRHLDDVKALVDYLFGVSLLDEFLENAGFYEAALDTIEYRPIALEEFRDPAVSRHRRFANETLPALFAENPLLVGLRRLGVQLDDAASRRAGGVQEMQALRDRIADLRGMFDQPRYAWMEDATFDAAVGFTGLLERVGGSALLGPTLAAEFERAARRGVEDVRNEMPDLRSFAVGPLLAEEGGRAVLEFSEPVAALDDLLAQLFERPFMRDGPAQRLPGAPPSGVVALWNGDRLDEGLALIDNYDDFMRTELQRAPSALHGMIRASAAERLGRAVNDQIARALEIGRGAAGAGLRVEEALRREVRSLSEAAPPLSRILAAYDDLALEDSYLDLSDLMIGHAVGLIEQADALFTGEAFYEPQGGDFSWWDGSAGLALEAFRARDRFELTDVLARQRERIQLLSQEYVRPLVGFLDAREVRLASAAETLVGKWRRIGDELEKYALRRADNSVSELESFITGPMTVITFATCRETLDSVGLSGDGARGGDFFLQRIDRLARGIRQRCADLAGVQAQTSYRAIHDAFGDRLAGRYPFVPAGYQEDAPEVSPRDLAAFFAVYDREAGPARQALTEAVDLGFARDRALDFLDRMDQVRALFGPWLEAPGADDAPVFDVSAAFRVNRPREAGANQVIEWALQIGPQRLDQRTPEASARWSLGEPVTLTLRWAENSTMTPALDPDRPELSVSGRTLSVSYANAWSLFELIRRFRAGSDDFEQFVDPRPHTLRVDAPTRPAGGGPVALARLFLRVELTAETAEGPQPVVAPTFPARAPEVLE